MPTLSLNPYPSFQGNLNSGFDLISSAAPTTVDELVEVINGFILSLYYEGPSTPVKTQVEVRSVAYNIINSYNAGALGGSISYNETQSNIIRSLINVTSNPRTPIISLWAWLDNIESVIGSTHLTLDDQAPLLMAVKYARSAYQYWFDQVDLGPASTWAPFFESQEYRNYINISYWMVACAEGTLIGANASNRGLISPTIDIVSVNIVSATIGALVIGAGKVMFKWVPEIPRYEITEQDFSIEPSVDNEVGDQPNIGSLSGPIRRTFYRDYYGVMRKDLKVFGLVIKFFPGPL